MTQGTLWGCAIFQPLTGFLIGYCFCRFFKLNRNDTLTIGLTTGIQNIQYSVSTFVNDYEKKSTFTSIVIYPCMLFICQLFWLFVYTSFIFVGPMVCNEDTKWYKCCNEETTCCHNYVDGNLVQDEGENIILNSPDHMNHIAANPDPIATVTTDLPSSDYREKVENLTYDKEVDLDDEIEIFS